MSSAVDSFQLAPMSRLIRILTGTLLTLPVTLLTLPVVLSVGAFVENRLAVAALLVIAIYLWVWLRFRPTRFVVHTEVLEVVWPCKRLELRCDDIAEVRLIDRRQLRREIGWCVRVGAGGLWGAFGWLWTQRRGIVQMYVSRTDDFVWIERVNARPWLITPERPEAFVRALAQ